MFKSTPTTPPTSFTNYLFEPASQYEGAFGALLLNPSSGLQFDDPGGGVVEVPSGSIMGGGPDDMTVALMAGSTMSGSQLAESVDQVRLRGAAGCCWVSSVSAHVVSRACLCECARGLRALAVLRAHCFRELTPRLCVRALTERGRGLPGHVHRSQPAQHGRQRRGGGRGVQGRLQRRWVQRSLHPPWRTHHSPGLCPAFGSGIRGLGGVVRDSGVRLGRRTPILLSVLWKESCAALILLRGPLTVPA